MNAKLLLGLASAMVALNVAAGSRGSASYSVPADSLDGGRRTTSASYANDGSMGGIGGVSTVPAPALIAKHSFIGQLFEVDSLAVSASPANVNEGATRQLAATATLDDGTSLVPAPQTVAWSVVSGPVNSIAASGLATAGAVYENTLATLRGRYFNRSNTFGLLVLNVDPDNFGTYAGDGIDDSWQVQYFGVNNPNARPEFDPDGDGQTNRYEYVVGTIPTDPSSLFRLRIEDVSGQPGRKNLIFSPRFPTRSYFPEYRLDAATGAFSPVPSVATADAGIERTVTDLQATNSTRIYRIRITFP